MQHVHRKLAHYYRAKSIYRIHSPYVFSWMNHCLKGERCPIGFLPEEIRDTLSSKQQNVLRKHLDFSQKEGNLRVWHKPVKGLRGVIVCPTSKLKDIVHNVENGLHSVVVAKNTTLDDRLWTSWSLQSKATITLECWNLGIAVYREGVVKQHFKIC